MREKEYDRKKAVAYAKKWAYLRNPRYYNFDNLGGDCTNFVSQCLYAGAKEMNYASNGWYYNSASDRSPSWTGVNPLHQFLTTNELVGPYGKEVDIDRIEVGDVAQLAFEKSYFTHTLLIVKIEKEKREDMSKLLLQDIYGASHTFDSYERQLSTYRVSQIRFIHVEGVRTWN